MIENVHAYNNAQNSVNKEICRLLMEQIQIGLSASKCKVWHGAPVWFIDDNPVVGYAVLKDAVQLLFWSGQSFDEPGLHAEGKFKAANAKYTNADQINNDDIQRWLKKSDEIQWDYKNIVKRRGILERLK